MRDVLIGQTDYTVLVKIQSTTGAPLTGLAYTDIDLAYSRVETDNDVTVADVTPATLASLTAAHSDWGWIEVDATNAPGLYRLDCADAVFASGAWEAVVTVTDASGTDFYATDIGFRLVGQDKTAATVKATDSKGNPLVPLSAGQVIRRSADGTVTYYTPASGTAAARGDAIIAAKNAASSGETIFIFFDATVTETLWADGVNWYIAEGCNLHGTAAEGLFVDAATGEGGDPLVPATFSINGGGVITSTSVPIIAGVNSKIRVHCRSVTATTGTNQAVNASGSGAEIWITATEKIQSAGYDCLLATSGGKIHIWTPYCQSAGVGANCVDIANTGSIVDGWVGRMKSEDPAINCISSGGIVNLVIGSIEVATDKSIVNNGCDVKIVCPSIVGQVVHTTGNTRLVGPTTIDTTAFSLASVTVAASGLVLENARIVTKSSETNSMSAASAQTVQVARAIEYNKALSNVTLSYVDSVGVIGPDAITAAAIAANAIGASELADGAIDTATFAAGTTVPRVTLVDTTTDVTNGAAGGATQASVDKVLKVVQANANK